MTITPPWRLRGQKENAMTIKEICTRYGLGQTALAKRFNIPLRTVQEWHGERRTPPEYVVSMMVELLEIDAEKARNKTE